MEEVLLPDATSCPCCGGALHEIDRDVARRLDKIPARHRVIVTISPKLACRTCSDGVLQAPAPRHLVPGGLPTEALVADVVVSKYADQLPLYRQEQILKRYGIDTDRATLANWVGRAAAVPKPLAERLSSTRSKRRSGVKAHRNDRPRASRVPNRWSTSSSHGSRRNCLACPDH